MNPWSVDLDRFNCIFNLCIGESSYSLTVTLLSTWTWPLCRGFTVFSLCVLGNLPTHSHAYLLELGPSGSVEVLLYFHFVYWGIFLLTHSHTLIYLNLAPLQRFYCIFNLHIGESSYSFTLLELGPSAEVLLCFYFVYWGIFLLIHSLSYLNLAPL